jgi:hypothetical protein
LHDKSNTSTTAVSHEEDDRISSKAFAVIIDDDHAGLCTKILVAQQSWPVSISVFSVGASRLQTPLFPRFWGSTSSAISKGKPEGTVDNHHQAIRRNISKGTRSSLDV